MFFHATTQVESDGVELSLSLTLNVAHTLGTYIHFVLDNSWDMSGKPRPTGDAFAILKQASKSISVLKYPSKRANLHRVDHSHHTLYNDIIIAALECQNMGFLIILYIATVLFIESGPCSADVSPPPPPHFYSLCDFYRIVCYMCGDLEDLVPVDEEEYQQYQSIHPVCTVRKAQGHLLHIRNKTKLRAKKAKTKLKSTGTYKFVKCY